MSDPGPTPAPAPAPAPEPTLYRIALPPPLRVATQRGDVVEQTFQAFVLYELLVHPTWRQRGTITTACMVRDSLLLAGEQWLLPERAYLELSACVRIAKLHPELAPYQLDFVAAIVEAPLYKLPPKSETTAPAPVAAE